MKARVFFFMVLVSATLQAAPSVRIVHVIVALCDNQHQGIVPVPAQLGNGDDPGSNLYWGALYGVRTVFDHNRKWKRIRCGVPDYPKRESGWDWLPWSEHDESPVLVRCTYRSETDPNVYLVADAYRGSRIRDAVADFFRVLAGAGPKYPGVKPDAGPAQVAMVVYVGHNGLMDFSLPTISVKPDGVARDAAVLACKSQPYFGETIRDFGGNPVLMTTGFMAPEGYVLEAALEGWVSGEGPDKIRLRAADAYHRYQKCGIKGARRLFGVQ